MKTRKSHILKKLLIFNYFLSNILNRIFQYKIKLDYKLTKNE